MTVKDRQCLLTFLKKADGTSYYTGDVDGIYGKLSRKAIQDFQRDFGGLSVTGEADEATDKALRHAVAYGMPEKEGVAVDKIPGNSVTVDKGSLSTGTFWDEIEFFDPGEFECTCGGRGCNGFPLEPVERLVRNADDARRHFGNVARVSSGVRCRLRNSELPGSASNSLHMRGKAMDFAIQGINSSRLVTYLLTLPDVDECYAIDSSYVHMGVLKYD